MRVQLIGAAALAQLMRPGETEPPDLAWLLHGPVDEAVVEAEPGQSRPWLLAAE
jgi:hypothetical protein